MTFAMVIGAWFLIGGIVMIANVGGPLWYSAIDLVLAYLPMGFLGGMLGGRGTNLSSLKPELED